MEQQEEGKTQRSVRSIRGERLNLNWASWGRGGKTPVLGYGSILKGRHSIQSLYFEKKSIINKIQNKVKREKYKSNNNNNNIYLFSLDINLH